MKLQEIRDNVCYHIEDKDIPKFDKFSDKENLNVEHSKTDYNKVSYIDSYDIKGDEVVFKVCMYYVRDYDLEGWRDTETFRFPLFTVIAYMIKFNL